MATERPDWGDGGETVGTVVVSHGNDDLPSPEAIIAEIEAAYPLPATNGKAAAKDYNPADYAGPSGRQESAIEFWPEFASMAELPATIHQKFEKQLVLRPAKSPEDVPALIERVTATLTLEEQHALETWWHKQSRYTQDLILWRLGQSQ